jgi:hypothetical protein
MKLIATIFTFFALAFALPCMAEDAASDAETLYRQALQIHLASNESNAATRAAKEQEALAIFTKAAKLGHSEALLYVGGFYDKGNIVQKDLPKAFSNYMQAATAGNPTAQFNVASMYLKGEGTVRDYTKAIEWFKKSAENGNAKAAYNLGVMYYTGEGVKQSESTAREWFKKSAENGNAFATFAIKKLGQDMSFYPRDLSDI